MTKLTTPAEIDTSSNLFHRKNGEGSLPGRVCQSEPITVNSVWIYTNIHQLIYMCSSSSSWLRVSIH